MRRNNKSKNIINRGRKQEFKNINKRDKTKEANNPKQ